MRILGIYSLIIITYVFLHAYKSTVKSNDKKDLGVFILLAPILIFLFRYVFNK